MAEGTVLFDRGQGHYVIGPPWAHEMGDKVHLPAKDVTVTVGDYDQKWPQGTIREQPGLRVIEDGGSPFITDGFRAAWVG